MRARRFGDQALLLECASVDEVRRVDAEARRRRADGRLRCADVVPGALTVLLDGLEDPAQVRSALEDWSLDDVETDERREVELAVTYDGPDLEGVAEHCGLSVDDLVQRLRATEYVVAFCGFAPGFAYLSGLPDELHVPRLESPRTSVPAGSVGLAGGFAGIYPTSSPGGWRLVARTREVLWRTDREPPALLTPGTVVRLRDE